MSPAGTGSTSAGLPLPPRTETGTGAAGDGGLTAGVATKSARIPRGGRDGTRTAGAQHCREGNAVGPVDGSPDKHEIQTQLTQSRSLSLHRHISGWCFPRRFRWLILGQLGSLGRSGSALATRPVSCSGCLAHWLLPSGMCLVFASALCISSPSGHLSFWKVEGKYSSIRQKALDHSTQLWAGQESCRSVFSPPET